MKREPIRVAVFSSKDYDKEHLEIANKKFGFDIEYYEHKLSHKTAITAKDFDAVCVFVNDEVDEKTLKELKALNINILALRCAGFDNVDLAAAKRLGITVVRVPAYSPEAVAEHAVALMMTLNRHTHKAYQRTRDANFSLDGLTGFNMHGRVAGVIGTGKIGQAVIRILKGFGMQVLAHDPYPTDAVVELGAVYVSLDELYAKSDVITLHCPMTPENYHLLSEQSFAKMKNGVMIINTSRGPLLDSKAAIDALKAQKIGALGMDVYENERDLFFEDKSNDVILDDVFRRLSSCHNVLFTGHQAFLTQEALLNISDTTLNNIRNVIEDKPCPNIVEWEKK
ncbi:2-hydroxyacid dehydrogenase [Orbaceae bacterium ESL0721]|nr:2-hydroxyacid dehydrogenase [Orbaceae bacterium ESL0721]